MIIRIRNSRLIHWFSLALAFVFSLELMQPLRLFALGSGPSQPEMAGFTPTDTDNMVDLFSGDFHYTVPIMVVPGPNGGFPVNLNYSSEVGMDHEASWVGLGWNLNPGAINRQVRGLPDDFNGDTITKTYMQRNNNTFIFTPADGIEVYGADFGVGAGLSLAKSFIYNTYNGISLSHHFGLSASYVRNSEIQNERQKVATLSGGLTLSSDDGITTSFSMNGGSKNLSLGFNVGYNSKSGSYTYGTQLSLKKQVEDVNFSTGFSVGTSFSTAAKLPPIHIPLQNSTFALSFQAGGGGAYVEGYGTVAASVCIQSTPIFPVILPAYGLCYAENATTNDLQDYNREKELCVDKDSKNLPLPVMTHDVYSIAGETMKGSFRSYRSDWGHFYDNKTEMNTITINSGMDVAVGAGLQVGVSASVNDGTSSSSDWPASDYNTLLSYKGKVKYADLPASQRSINPTLYEPFYFKMSGEQTASNVNYLNDIGNEKPVSFTLHEEFINSFWGGKSYKHTINSQLSSNMINHYEQANRTNRTSLIEYRTGANPTAGRKAHHIASFSIVNSNGERYTYGKTLYNQVEKEVIFSVPYYNSIDNTTLAYNTNYTKSNANGTQRVGKERLYSCTETKPYAYSYLLTEITSPDYVDMSGQGPDDQSLGYWVKFSYDTKYSGTNLYTWRFPYMGANFQMGDRSNQTDDKGSYNYGKKEIAYVKSIETKTHKAKFYISQRLDACGASTTNNNGEWGGGKDNSSASLYKLDSIALFSKADTTLPIKTAVFVYDYSLCPNIPNGTNNQGKLTLKSVYFKYAESEKGEESPYIFHYCHDSQTYNPNYDPKKMDRWGNYKGNANYFEHYTSQDAQLASQYAQAWLLTKIELPTGGAIEIDYESDDYAYVQDKQAMYMAKMTTPTSFAKENGNYYVYFAKSNGINAKEYVSGFKNNQLFFKAAIRYQSDYDPDYIQGYMEIYPESATNYSATVGKVRVKPFDGYDIHPVWFLALQYLKNSRPDLLFNNADADENQSDTRAFFRALISRGILDKVKKMYGENQAFYKSCIRHKDFKDLVMNNNSMPSYLRLNVPTKIKYGGGVRVKAITMEDNWVKSEAGTYRKEYYYRTLEGSSVISSGVAEYEPIVGAEETALRYPIYDKVKKLLFQEDQTYSEEPYGESYFPAANVGYSQVIVRKITPNDVTFSTSGIERHEFYTAKDFPIRLSQTMMSAKFNTVPDLLSMITAGFCQANTSAYSQGYQIELNNMHGQQKAVSICPYINAPNVNQLVIAVSNSGYTSKIEYFYKTKNGNQIDNVVDVLLGDGIVEKKILGQTYDFVIDQRENHSESIGGGVAGQFMLGTWYPPTPGGSAMPSFDKFEERVRSVATTKVIYNTGILETVKSYNKGSITVQKNLQFDPYTGNALLTTTTNAFEEPIYTYSMPAYWYYPNMGNAAQNYRAIYFDAIGNFNNTFDRFDRIPYFTNSLLPIYTISNNNASCWNSTGTTTSISLASKEIMRSRFSNQTSAISSTVASLTKIYDVNNKFVPMLDAFNASDTDCFQYRDCREKNHFTRVIYANNILYFFANANTGPKFCGLTLAELIQSEPHIFASVTLPDSNAYNYSFDKKGNTICVYSRANHNYITNFPWNNTDNVFEECLKGVLQAETIEYKDSVLLEFADAGMTVTAPNYLGIPNIYRPVRSNVYVTEREQTGTNFDYKTNVAYDGTFHSFLFFDHKKDNGSNIQTPWTWNAEITKYSPFSFELENRNALNIYSSVLYGYKNSMVTAVANNAHYEEIGFDSFENDSEKAIGQKRGHIICTGTRTNTQAHTGSYSLLTSNNQTAITVRVVNNTEGFNNDGTINLIKDATYILSCWVRKADCATVENNGNIYGISIGGNNYPIELEKKIDCWQRIEVPFSINTTTITSFLLRSSLSSPFNFYIDDIRIMPTQASFKSYVYDPANYRVIAYLDENNYATFYNYDEEGILVQIKKETERGTQTVQTTRQSLPKR